MNSKLVTNHTINVETTYAKILQQLVTGSLPFIFRILFFVFVRSIRDGDFKLHIICLKSMTQLMFVLDPTYYARWLHAFTEDMIKLS